MKDSNEFINSENDINKLLEEWEKDENEGKSKIHYNRDMLNYDYGIGRFSFNNFKPFGKKMQSFSKKPITLIYGPNSIGKSSLIHLMVYHNNQQFDVKEINAGDTISLENFKEFVHKKNTKSTIDFQYFLGTEETTNIVMKIGISEGEKKAKDKYIRYTIENETFLEILYNPNEKCYYAKPNLDHRIIKLWLNRTKNSAKWENEEFEQALNNQKPSVFPIDIIKEHFIKNGQFKNLFYNDSDEITGYKLEEIGYDMYHAHESVKFRNDINFTLNWTQEYENKKITVSGMSKLYRVTYEDSYIDPKVDIDNSFMILRGDVILSLKSIVCQRALELVFHINENLSFNKEPFSYIGPLRFYPERGSTFQKDSQSEDLNSQRIWSELKNNPDLIMELNNWFSNKKLNLPYEIAFKKYYDLDDIHSNAPSLEEMYFKDTRSNTLVHNREMGLGVTQLLPIIVDIFGKKQTTIAIEQPELHLHPALQMEIADEFIRSYKKQHNKFLIETHSEHLLLRIMKRMRYTAEDKADRDKSLDLTPDDVCLLYIDSNDKITYINELELDNDGSLLDPWPNGFFEEGYRERFD